ncbi:MAG: hypothetical protein ACT4P9_16380 [Betaproteobacteria bacterium]
MAAGDNQLVPVEFDLIHQQSQVGFAQARGRVGEALLERLAERFHGVGVHAPYRERLAVFELGHLRENLAAPRLELLRARAQRFVDGQGAIFHGLVEAIQARRRPVEFRLHRDEPGILGRFRLALVPQQCVEHEGHALGREHLFG